MSRIPSGEREASNELIVDERARVDNVPKPIAIVPFATAVIALTRHDEAEPPPVLTIGNPTTGQTPSTTTTTTITTTTSTPTTSTTARRRMARGLSEHRLPKRLARSEQTPPVRERSRSPSPMGASAPIRKESPSGSESHSADDIPTPMPVFRKVTLNQGARQNSENRLAGRQLSDRRLPRQMAKTADAPPRARDEHSSPPMGTSALDAPRHDLDSPEQWRKDWRRQVETIVQSRWCSKALLMIDLSKATLPDPRSFLNTRGLMRVAFKHKLTVAEAASIYLYTSALYRDINQPLLNDSLSKLRKNRRDAVETMIRNMDSGLKKLPSVKEPLIRVVDLDKDFLDSLQVGADWHGKSFGSSTRAMHRNMKWDGNCDLIFIDASGAHDVSAFSDAPKEREVLIERGRSYTVTRRDESDERITLVLQEAPALGEKT